MLTSKEVMQLEDFLGMEQSFVKSLNHLASTIQCNQTKQLFQQMAQKNQQHFQTLSKHLNVSQTLQ
jgi:ferritin-like metal-binding protein YciE